MSSAKLDSIQSEVRSRSSSSKRKTPSSSQEPNTYTPPKKPRASIIDLVASQAGNIPPDEKSVPATLERASIKSTPPKPRTFAEMYTFTSRTKPAELIDLTLSKSPLRNGLKGANSMRPFGQPVIGGPKKLVVKNLKTTAKIDPTEYLERRWRDQETALNLLFQDEGNKSKIMLEDLYKATEHICRQGNSARLFTKLSDKCLSHLSEQVRPVLVASSQYDTPVRALQKFVDAWRLWQRQLQTIRHIYFYLNQAYLIKTEHGDLNQLGMQMFKSAVYQDLDVAEIVMSASMQLLASSRSGDTSQDNLLKEAVSIFHDLQVYTSHFEPKYVSTSATYLKEWQISTAQANLPQFVGLCSNLLEAETARCRELNLDHSTQVQLLELFDEICVEENVARLAHQDSVYAMLKDDRDTELGQTWSLLSRRHSQQLLNPSFAKYIEDEGTLIVFDETREDEMVVRLLAFKRKLDHIHVHCFNNDDQMGNTLHKSFEIFMNKTKRTSANWDTDNAKSGEMIAKHIDLLMKGGVKAIPKLKNETTQTEPEAEQVDPEQNEEDSIDSIEAYLADSLDLFRHVQGKAVFEAFYKKDLARRLLMGRTQSFDAERSMLTRLRNECGANFTHNLESMFKDMDLAREEMKAYSQLLVETDRKPSVEVAVNVLSVAAWPTYPVIPVNMPTSILKAQHDFESHYKDKHVGRKLTWKPALATCQLRARFAKAQKELVVSGFQAIVLLLFNKDATLSYSAIATATALPEAEIKRTLQSLACGRYKVLNKTPKGRDVNDTDTFSFNASFTDARYRIKINQIQLKETKEENKETHQRVAADRHYETQAAIVRILKGRKKIGHNELIVEVIKATRSRGVLDQSDIKKNIEKLIEKDYMERDNEIKGYAYLA